MQGRFRPCVCVCVSLHVVVFVILNCFVIDCCWMEMRAWVVFNIQYYFFHFHSILKWALHLSLLVHRFAMNRYTFYSFFFSVVHLKVGHANLLNITEPTNELMKWFHSIERGKSHDTWKFIRHRAQKAHKKKNWTAPSQLRKCLAYLAADCFCWARIYPSNLHATFWMYE